MSRLRAGAAVVAVVAFGGLPAVAAASPSALTGETLTAKESAFKAPYPFFLTCGNGPPAKSGPHFTYSGKATGPYAGSFVESGNAVYAAECDAPPTVQEPLTSYSASFKIHTTRDTITGTETMTGSATVTIEGSAGGGGVTVGPVSTKYKATITTPQRICTDTGTSSVTLDQSFALGTDWYANLQDGPLSSAGTLSCRVRP